MVARHDQRASEINGRYDQMRAEQIQRSNEILASVDALLQYLVPTDDQNAPLSRVEDKSWMVELRDTCKSLREKAEMPESPGEPPVEFRKKQANECDAFASKLYVKNLTETYYRADRGWVVERWRASGSAADLESLFAQSHNDSIRASVARGHRDVEALRNSGLAEIETMRQRDLAASAEQMNSEIEQAEERRQQSWQAVAVGLQALGNGLSGAGSSQATETASSPSAGAAATAESCSSDYSCGIGSRCVKPNFSGVGVCMRAVNEYGVQTFGMPDPNSVFPKTPKSTDCNQGAMCPPMFHCDYLSGACVKDQ
jgi:hypothetical protein